MSEHTILPLLSSVVGNNERTTIADRVYNYCNPILTDDKDGTVLLEKVKTNTVTLQKAFSDVGRTSPYTPKLKDIVLERKAVIIFVKMKIKAEVVNILDPKAMKAAKTLQLALSHALKSHRITTYAGGSRAVKEVLLQCEKKKVRESFKYLKLEPAIDALAELQEGFSSTYTTKVSTEHKKKEVNIKKASQKLFVSLERFFNHIAVSAHLHKGMYIPMIKTINEIIEDVNIIARMAKAKTNGTLNEQLTEEKDINENGAEQAA